MIGEDTENYLNEAVESEYDCCVTKHGGFKNHHEAYAVTLEEVQEAEEVAELFAERVVRSAMSILWFSVRQDVDMFSMRAEIERIYDTAEELAKECIQVMAVCQKWMRLINKEREEVE